jgi:hypothetical protein
MFMSTNHEIRQLGPLEKILTSFFCYYLFVVIVDGVGSTCASPGSGFGSDIQLLTFVISPQKSAVLRIRIRDPGSGPFGPKDPGFGIILSRIPDPIAEN